MKLPNARHQHADILIAIANGETIEWRLKYVGQDDWEVPEDAINCLSLYGDREDSEFRVKPKQQTVWMNIYTCSNFEFETGCIFPSKAKAEEQRDDSRTCIACVQVNWTVGEGL